MKYYYIYILLLFTSYLQAQNYYGTPVPGVVVLPSSEQTDTITTTIGASSVPNVKSFATASTGTSTEVGTTSGQLSVSLSGAATYSIPMTLPPGINGVAPQISLNYNSQSGNGIAGYGWGVSGISSITRIASTVFHDGIIDPVDYDNLDRFALDGQRLILKSGTYGAAGAVYETENFSTVKITSLGTSAYGSNYGPASFKVEYADGSYALYGDKSNSSSRNDWAITYWQNAQGVSIIYEYTSNSNNTTEISKIKYGSTFQNTPINIVSFNNGTRTRQESAYIGGSKLTKSNLLNEIEITANGNAFRKYSLGYNTTSLQYQRLISVTEKSGANYTKSYNPTLFSYDTTSDGVLYNNINTTVLDDFSNIASTNSVTTTGDFSGDGAMDFILYATTGTLAKNKYWVTYDIKSTTGPKTLGHPVGAFEAILPTTYLSGDATFGYKLMTNPGWVVIKKDGTNLKFSTYCLALNTSTPGINLQYEFSIPSSSLGGFSNKYYTGDFNEDGLTDIISVNNTTGAVYFINLDKRLSTHYQYSGALSTLIADGAADVVSLSDFNGDGKSDIFHFKNNQLKIYGFNDSNILVSLYSSTSDPVIKTNYPIMIGDYNGDGKADFIIPSAPDSTNYYRYTSTGTSFETLLVTFTNMPYKVSVDATMNNYIPTDFNNDGKTDIIKFTIQGTGYSPGSITLQTLVNTNGLTSSVASTSTATTGSVSGIDVLSVPLFLNPQNGNPKMELAALRNNKIYYFQSQKDFSKEKLLRSVTTGNGAVETITYSPLIDTCATSSCVSDYNDDPLKLNYPFFDITASPSFTIVNKLERQSTDVYQQQTYRYLGAVTHLDGLGFIGFKSVLKTNWYTNNSDLISSVTNFDMTKRGAIRESYSVEGWGALNPDYIPTVFISKSIPTYQEELSASKIYKLKQTFLKEYNGLENTSKLSSYAYDDFNNLVTEYTSTNAISGSVTTNQENTAKTFEFENAPAGSPYYIGKLIKTTKSVGYIAGTPTMTSEESYVYNNDLFLPSQKKVKGTDTDYLTEDYIYDAFGNITTKTLSAVGAVSRSNNYKYDPSGRFLIESKDIEQLATAYTNDLSTGQVLTVTDPYNNSTTYAYDSWGKNTSVTNYLQKTDVINYSVYQSGMTEINKINADASTSYTRLDDLGREIISGVKNIDGTWSYVKKAYDGYNRVVSVSEPYNDLAGAPTQFSTVIYDIYGRIVQQKSFTGKITNITYNGLTTTSNDGTVTQSIVKNSLGYITSKTDMGGTISYSYYSNGNLKQSSFGGTSTLVEQDGWGRRTKLTDSSAGVYSYEYNSFGETTKEITPKGTTTYTLDDFGKLNTKTIVGDNTNTTVTNVYDGTTKLLTQTNFNPGTYGDAITYLYNYDEKKRLYMTTEQLNQGIFYVRQTEFDTIGRPSRELYSAATVGNTLAYSDKWVKNVYKNGYLYQILDDATSSMLWQANSVNARGQIKSASYGNGFALANTYDDYGFISEIKHTKTSFGSSSVAATPAAGSNTTFDPVFDPTPIPNPITRTVTTITLGYTFNAQKGLLNSRTNSMFNWTENFEYDNLERLTKSPRFLPLCNENFTTGLGNFEVSGSATLSNVSGALRVTTTATNSGIIKPIIKKAIVGDKLKFSMSLNKGTTNLVKVMIWEFDDNTGNATTTMAGYASSGTFTFEYTVAQYSNVSLFILRDPSSVDTGASPYFTIDNFVVNAARQETQTYDATGKIKENSMGQYQYTDATKPYQNTELTYNDKSFDYYSNKAPDLYSDDMETNNGWVFYTADVTYETSTPANIYRGNRSLKVSKPTPGEVIVHAASSVAINNAADTQYTYSVWVKSNNPTVDAVLVMKKDDETGYATQVSITSTAIKNQWVQLKLPVMVPANIRKLILRIDNNGGGIVWFDDAKIVKGDGAATTPQPRDLYVTYNAFKAPVDIQETTTQSASFTYNLANQRSAMYYGSNDPDKLLRPMQKFYSADGTMEIKYNKTTQETEFVTYIGGNAYSAPIVLKSKNQTQEYLYLHRDYQGSIVAISNATGNVVERRLFDAWGEVLAVTDADGNALAGLTILDRGYTGHEHLQAIGLIHMNGRLYDPKLHRFLQPDNNIQDPYNTQNYNRYGYVLNNPLKYTDPSGESFEFPGGGSPQGGGSGSDTSGLSDNQQSAIGSAIATLVNNWDEWKIKDFFNNNVSNGFKSATNWASNNFKSAVNDVSKYFRDMGRGFRKLFGEKKAEQKIWNPQHSGSVSGSWQGDSFRNVTSGPLEAIPSSVKNLMSDIWNHPLTRLIIKDSYSIGLSSNVAAFLGVGSTPLNVTLLTRGEAGIYGTPALNASVGTGIKANAGVNFSSGLYTGDPHQIKASFLQGHSVGLSVGVGFVLDASVQGSYAPANISKPLDGGFINVGMFLGLGIEGSPVSGANIQLEYQYTAKVVPLIIF